jgi:glucokinase
MILAADVGGTKCNLALFPDGRGRREPERQASIPSADHRDFESVVDAFLEGTRPVVAAMVVGVAGPVLQDSARITNLPWTIRASSLAERLRTPRVGLLNDLQATALGLDWLRPEETASLQAGSPRARGNLAILAAGTGLGEAALIADGDRRIALASEGGHCDFAPIDEADLELWRWLREENPRVTFEMVLSGPGLVNLYRFLHRSQSHPPLWEPGREHRPEAAALVSTAAMQGACPQCRESLERFVTLWGAEAGNLALKVLATGGVYLAGGIAPKILPVLRDGRFTEAFNAKEPHADLMRSIPVRVVLNDATALLGAARAADDLAA